MKNKLFLLAAAFCLGACSQGLKVEVSNPTAIDRDDETVEIAWDQLAALKGVTPENVIVCNDEGEQVPSQVLFRGKAEPQALIFQADVDGMESEHFTIGTGIRAAYPAEAFGRQVPERYDDYAWENNKVAYRLYGPALETSPEKLITPGIDVWVKCTDKLVIDEWYAKGDYHHNYGDGMDCYKVGKTLGGGSSVPFIDGKLLLLPHNYQTCKKLDNGPIRTSVELTYAPFAIDDTHTVALTKIITLDANQRFNRMESIYSGDFEEFPVAAGFVRHDVKQTETGEDWVAICEPASDSKDPVRDGDIFGAVVWDGAAILPETEGHALAVKNVRPDEPMIYYAGTGWSQGGVDDMDKWIEDVNELKAAVETPLQVIVK
ncbi:MAG: DUF4861 domain-containing protein [Alistipes sp.]|jgi:hypothetical protein